MIKPTIYEALYAKLGREPRNAELKAEVDRIKQEALVDLAGKGKLQFQRGRKAKTPTKKTPPAQLQREIDEALARREAFEQARIEEARVEREMAEAEQALTSVTADIAERFGVSERGPMGLTPDIVKETPEWRAAKARAGRAFAELRSFNAAFVKRFAKELRSERSERTRMRESRSAG